MTDLITAQETATANLPQLEIEIKFYLGQTAQNIIEVGKRLIQAKSLVQHGHWQQWLNDNFQLKQRSAQTFMACAERFGNTQTSAFLNQSQMIEMLSLPDAEETEKFIAEKAAEGKAVADMTIKQLREEIAGYKATIEQKDKTYQQSLFDLNEQNKAVVKQINDKYQRKLDDLNEQLAATEQELKDRPTVTPEDYQPTKDALVDAKVALKLAEDAAQKQAAEFKKQSDEAADKLQKAVEKIAKLKEEKKRSEDIQKQLYEIKQRGIEIPTEVFDVIVIDPPWGYVRQAGHGSFDANGRRCTNPYPEMTQDELKALKLPAADNCVLFLWTTHKFIWDAKELLDHWGFNYRCMLVWNKQMLGTGNLIRMQCEFCLIGLKGKPTFKDVHNIRDILEEPRREHSRKPDAFYQLVDELCVGRKLDYFSRQHREGWVVYGNDTDKFNVA